MSRGTSELGTNVPEPLEGGRSQRPSDTPPVGHVAASETRLWPSITLISVALLVGLSVWSAPPPILAPWDTFTLLDGAYRITEGQVPGLDFGNPIGPLLYGLVALGMRIQHTPSLAAVAYGNALFVVAATALAWGVARHRLSGPYAAGFTVFVASILVAVRPLNFSPSVLSYAMLYNRYGWVLFATILLQLLLRPLVPWTSRRHVSQGLLLGLSLGLLLYTKITFFLVAAATAAVGLLLGLLPQRLRLLAAAVTGFLAVLVVMRVALGVHLVAYLGDVAEATRAQSAGMRLVALERGIAHSVPVAVLTALVLGRMMVTARRAGQPLRPVVELGVAAAYVVGCCVLLTVGNAAEGMELPALAIIPLLLLAWPRLSRPRFSPDRTATIVDTGRDVPVLVGIGALLLVTAGLVGVKDTASLGRSVALRGAAEHPPASQRFASAHLHDFVIPSDADYDTAYRSSKALPVMVNDGLAMLRRNVRPTDTVVTLGNSDPFSFALDLPSGRGGLLWWDWGFDFNERVHPDAQEMLGGADWVMLPQMVGGQGCCQATPRVMLDIYGGYLSTHFHQVERTSHWILLERRPRS
jgi:hypothetical protein